MNFLDHSLSGDNGLAMGCMVTWLSKIWNFALIIKNCSQLLHQKISYKIFTEKLIFFEQVIGPKSSKLLDPNVGTVQVERKVGRGKFHIIKCLSNKLNAEK